MEKEAKFKAAIVERWIPRIQMIAEGTFSMCPPPICTPFNGQFIEGGREREGSLFLLQPRNGPLVAALLPLIFFVGIRLEVVCGGRIPSVACHRESR